MKVESIRATSRASVKIKDSFYTVEWSEEWSIDPTDELISTREKLWEQCNREVDNQIEDILKSFGVKK